MTGDRAEETLKWFIVTHFKDLLNIKNPDGSLKYPELVKWKYKNIIATNYPNKNIKELQHEIKKNKDIIFSVETQNKSNKIEKDVVLYNLIRDKSGKVIKKVPLVSFECKLCKYLKHVENKTNKDKVELSLFKKILQLNPKYKNLDFSQYLAYFLTPNSQEDNNDYYVFCFDEIKLDKTDKNDRQTNPTKLSFLTKEELNSKNTNDIIKCPAIDLDQLHEIYKKYKNSNYFDEKELEILEYFSKINKEELTRKQRSAFWYISDQSGRIVILCKQNKTHKVAEGIYRDPKTNKFTEASKTVEAAPLINNFYASKGLNDITNKYALEHLERMEKEREELAKLDQEQTLQGDKDFAKQNKLQTKLEKTR